MIKNPLTNQNAQSVILCDSILKIDELKQIILTHNPKIISFTLESHNFLNKNGIEHDLSESFLNNDDFNVIQDNSHKFSKWYSDIIISKFFEFNGINIGELFYLEFCDFLTPILKKIYEIMKIYEVYENALFFSSASSMKFIQLFSSNIKILNDNLESISLIQPNKIQKFNINYLIENKSFFIISNIVKISYFLYKILFQNKKLDSNKKTIFLFNYTTKKYKNFFKELPNHSINLIKYDTTIPAFWDLESFRIIKKSNCYIEYSSIMSKVEKSSNLDKQISYILQNEEFFAEFFSLEGYSFWNIIKNNFIEMYKKSFLIANQNMEKIDFLLKKYNPKYIVVNSECSPLDIILIKIAQKYGIRIGLLQHGLYDDDLEHSNHFAFKSCQFHTVFSSSYSDDFLVWDKLTQNQALKNNVNLKKIIQIGCPFFDMFFDVNKNNKNNDDLKNNYILLAITPIINSDNPQDSSTKIQLEYNDTIKRICQISIKLNKKLIIKVHHGITFDEKIIGNINPNITIKNNGSFYQYAKNCELLICIDNSTAILETMLLKKPIISILIKDKNSNSKIFQDNYTVKIKISDLEKILTRLDSDNDFRISCIEHGNQYIHDYFFNLGNSTKTLLKFLSKVS